MELEFTPERRWFNLGFRQLWRYRELLITLASRDVKLRYKQTALGIIWVILQPILTSVIFTVIFGMLADLPSEGAPYALFAFAGILPWDLFSQSVQRAGSSLVRDTTLITKVHFPRMIIPIASSASALVDMFINLIAFLLISLALFGVFPNWKIALLPVFLLINLLIALGIGLIVSALNVYYRDFVYAMPAILQIWLYISPIAYSSTLIPENWQFLYHLNPLVGVIEGFRWMLLDVSSFPWVSFSRATLVGVIIFFFGALVFKRIEEDFADVI